MAFRGANLKFETHLTVPELGKYILGDLPANPGAFDYATRVQGGFPMALNDQIGDCTIAGVIHLLQLAYAAVGQQFAYPGDGATDSTYFAMTGGQDTGLDPVDVLTKWQQQGLFGTQILGFARIDIRNHSLMARAAYNFGGLYLAGYIPQDAETQFPGNWTLAPGSNPGTGGHCFVGSGVETLGVDNITWGAENAFTWNWWRFYGSQCYVVIPALFAQVKHGPLANVDIARLEADCTKLGH